MGKTSSEVKRRYNAKVYDRITVSVPKALASDFKEKCQLEGVSMAAIIKAAMEEYLKDK